MHSRRFIASYSKSQLKTIEEAFNLLEGMHFHDYAEKFQKMLMRKFPDMTSDIAHRCSQLAVDAFGESWLKNDGKRWKLLVKLSSIACDECSSADDAQKFLEDQSQALAKTMRHLEAQSTCPDIAQEIAAMPYSKLVDKSNDAVHEPSSVKDSTSGKHYSVVPVCSYEQFNQLFGGDVTGWHGSAWCHANSKSSYDKYCPSNARRKLFVIAQDGWQHLKPSDDELAQASPYGAYGLSLVSIVVDAHTGRLLFQNTRWNHKKKPFNGLVDNAFGDSWLLLKKMLGFDVQSEVLAMLGLS